MRLRNVASQSSKSWATREADQQRLRFETKELIAANYELVCVDECCFTWRGYKKMDWSPKYENLELCKCAGGPKQQCVACIGAVSLRGKELFCYNYRSINGDQFLDYVIQLKQHMGNRKFFM